MAMTKEQKTSAVEELVQKLEQSPTVYLTNYSGLTVAQANELRGKFRAAGVEFKVVKNTLLRLAMDRVGGYEDLLEYLTGPTAIAFTAVPSAPARVIEKFVKDQKTEHPSLKGAHVEGAVYHEGSLKVLAKLKSRDELISDIISLLQAPMVNIVGAILAPGSNLVGSVKAISERKN